MMDSLGSRIKSLRTEKGLSRQSLGEIVGVNADVINNLERDRNKTVNEPLVRAIAQEFGVNKQWLLTGEGQKEEEQTSDLARLIVDIKTGKNAFAAKYIDFLASLSDDEWEVFEKQTAIIKQFYDELD